MPSKKELKTAKKMTKKEKDGILRDLKEKKASIVKRISQFYNESKEMETNTAQDLVDKAESSYTKEFLLSLSDADRENLELIDAAIKRLESGDFGDCQLCGNVIGSKRLNALPWTPYCIDCQEKVENETQNT
ncbi:MAG: TraR/DksA family transcriptional regulator [Acidobacteriota bacterium]|nr:TraR/DksA family transcriptional regulator [Acidobacteriota bacterium]